MSKKRAATQDADPATSEGIFVFATTPDVNTGDRVRVRGTITEFTSTTTGQPPSTLTEVGGAPTVTICSTGNPLPPRP